MVKLIETIKEFTTKCIRVWHILRKPDMPEYKKISKIAALGILAIGLIGFVISVVIAFF
jgi:protein translocase SEC61 complex gamma subunit